VIGFLNHQRGDNKLPDPVSEAAIKNFLKLKEKQTNKISNHGKIEVDVGDLVKITEGAFINREGRITHLDQKRQKAKIIIEPSD
jgi:transcription antitermination factor NusG